MSLTPAQVHATKAELQQNLALTGYTTAEVATALQTTPENINAILALHPRRIEDPWILRHYLLETLTVQHKQPVPFTALTGNYHQYWFLDADYIAQQHFA